MYYCHESTLYYKSYKTYYIFFENWSFFFQSIDNHLSDLFPQRESYNYTNAKEIDADDKVKVNPNIRFKNVPVSEERSAVHIPVEIYDGSRFQFVILYNSAYNITHI